MLAPALFGKGFGILANKEHKNENKNPYSPYSLYSQRSCCLDTLNNNQNYT